ncbi:MAG: FAD-dependent oxidoreductase [Desulfobacterota bacterium]|nr:FAD-dependent oxidoreductase [Thermodesulfobacteriota bacterium]
MAKKIVVIGGSAAGPKAAARARRLDGDAEITIIQKDPDLSMASCGYPYYVGRVIHDRSMLISTPAGVVRNPAFFLNTKKIVARTATEAVAINCKGKTVLCKDLSTGTTDEVPYDRLILATGSLPNMPTVPGVDLDGITTLQSMRDADYLRTVCDEQQIKKAVVVGGGLIGIETCEALRRAGIEVTVVEMLPQILAFLDRDLALLVENYLRNKGVHITTGNGVAAFLGSNGKLAGVRLQNGAELDCALAVVAIGVRPNTALARAAGLAIGQTGGILVNEYLQTSDENIYAAGDCIETVNLLTGKKVHAPYGDLANLQGRVAGENAVLENVASFPGTIQTGICKVFDYAVGTTGLSEQAARQAGFDVLSVVNAGTDKPAFMNGKLLITRLVAERATGRILGAQCIGAGDVAKQIGQWAMAITGKLRVDDIVTADLPYAPPFSQAIDHCIATAHLMQNKMRGVLKGISASEVYEKLSGGDKPFLLDVRGPDEFNAMRIGAGEQLIPLGALRTRLGELPVDKNREIICYCKISLRGYEAARILEAHGWKNVRVMEGGIMAWPFPREK